MKCKDCGRGMKLVMTETTRGRWLIPSRSTLGAVTASKKPVTEKAWVCLCKQHCVSGPMHSAPVWNPALSLMPGGSVCHAGIWGALRLLDGLPDGVKQVIEAGRQ